ncbi:argininosuccinate lyase [Magnetococcales bacterium HHB-1]
MSAKSGGGDNTSNQKKLWGGRFAQSTDELVELFSASIQFDIRLYRQDIKGSRVHCQMLARQGIISQEDADKILAGLEQVEKEISEGKMPISLALEDIHMHVESRLQELIGSVAGKLHTARSRNDQVATDLRLYLRENNDIIRTQLRTLQRELLNQAEKHVETVLPGFTHLQIAQPISLAHHLLAYLEMFQRDYDRLLNMRSRINQLPLGSAALAGSTFPIDREWVAKQLKFDGLCQNSLDAVSDRDFVIEFAAAGSILMMHLSRLSEELILWNTPAFSFVELPDAFCTGSSIMPQKKNPDVPELIRGRSGRVYGNLINLLTLMKSLPLAYNRDMQEDKEPIFDTIDTVQNCLSVINGLIPGIIFKKEAMKSSASEGFSVATDLADYLVRKNIPFRQAHEITGNIVSYAIDKERTLEELSLQEMQNFEPRIEKDIFEAIALETSVNARTATGGTAFESVHKALKKAKERLLENA